MEGWSREEEEQGVGQHEVQIEDRVNRERRKDAVEA
jgi:hypothetical protein